MFFEALQELIGAPVGDAQQNILYAASCVLCILFLFGLLKLADIFLNHL